MEIKFDVHITSHVLYDYLMQHIYHSTQGILGTTVGALLVVLFAMRPKEYLLALIFGIIILLYLPVSMWLKAKAQALNPVFKEPLHYVMNEEGVSVSQGETTQEQLWENLYKAVSTKTSIILYTSRLNACIFPREDLKEQTAAVIEAISTHMDPGKVKIRG